MKSVSVLLGKYVGNIFENSVAPPTSQNIELEFILSVVHHCLPTSCYPLVPHTHTQTRTQTHTHRHSLVTELTPKVMLVEESVGVYACVCPVLTLVQCHDTRREMKSLFFLCYLIV